MPTNEVRVRIKKQSNAPHTCICEDYYVICYYSAKRLCSLTMAFKSGVTKYTQAKSGLHLIEYVCSSVNEHRIQPDLPHMLK